MRPDWRHDDALTVPLAAGGSGGWVVGGGGTRSGATVVSVDGVAAFNMAAAVPDGAGGSALSAVTKVRTSTPTKAAAASPAPSRPAHVGKFAFSTAAGAVE